MRWSLEPESSWSNQLLFTNITVIPASTDLGKWSFSHNSHTILPPLCRSEGTDTQIWKKRNPVAIWAAFDIPLETWCALEKPEAGRGHQQRLGPSVSPAGPVSEPSPCLSGWMLLNQGPAAEDTGLHRINQHRCGICDEFTCVSDSWIALIKLWWFSCVTLYRLSALLAVPSAVARACCCQTRSIALTNINRLASWITASLMMLLTS